MSQPNPKKLFIAADHAGVDLKAELKKRLSDWQWEDLGPMDANRVDYPDYAQKLADLVAAQNGRGVLICGSGIGMSIAANKVPGVRAAVVENISSARLAREHNDANVLCLGSRFVAPEYAAEITQAWLSAQFGGGRHEDRVRKIGEIEKNVLKGEC